MWLLCAIFFTVTSVRGIELSAVAAAAAAALTFNPACNRATYNIVPSNTSLPIPSSTDTVIDSLLSGSSLVDSDSGSTSGSGGGQQNLPHKHATFMAMYHKGLQDCEAFARRDMDNSSRANDFNSKHVLNKMGLYKGCRGRKLLRSLTGMVVWPFGPVQACSTHSTCW